MSLEEVRVVERGEVHEGCVMLFGFPDVGLVGVIAASHLASRLEGLREVASVESELLPPLVVLHEGLPHSPIRVFGNHNVLLALSEAAIPADLIYPVMRALIDWGRSRKVKMMISLSGIPVPERHEIEKLKVFAAASSPEALRMVQESGHRGVEGGVHGRPPCHHASALREHGGASRSPPRPMLLQLPRP
jgi:uncharacterized protein